MTGKPDSNANSPWRITMNASPTRRGGPQRRKSTSGSRAPGPLEGIVLHAEYRRAPRRFG